MCIKPILGMLSARNPACFHQYRRALWLPKTHCELSRSSAIDPPSRPQHAAISLPPNLFNVAWGSGVGHVFLQLAVSVASRDCSLGCRGVAVFAVAAGRAATKAILQMVSLRCWESGKCGWGASFKLLILHFPSCPLVSQVSLPLIDRGS